MAPEKQRAQWRAQRERYRRKQGIPVRVVRPWQASGLPRSTYYYRRAHTDLPLLSPQRQVEALLKIVKKRGKKKLLHRSFAMIFNPTLAASINQTSL
jgi:hypothetical protein